jgi:enolase
MAWQGYSDLNGSTWLIIGVSKAIANINEKIAPKLLEADLDLADQKSVDEFLIKLDGTENKCNLYLKVADAANFGANAILGVSMAVCRAGAAQKVCLK